MDVYVRRWDEEVVKWLAVGMVLAMVGLAVMPAVGVANYGWVWGAANAAYSAAKGDYLLAAGNAIIAVATLATIATAGATTPLWVVAVAY